MLTCIECNIVQEGDAIHHDPNGDDLCGTCADVYYVECDDCCALIKRDDIKHKYKGSEICYECYDSDYTECADCDELLHTENDPMHNNDSEETICEGCSDAYCYDELNDCMISMDNAVSAISITRGRQTEIMIHTDNATCINGDYYTEAAVDELFTSCEGCGEYVDCDNALYSEDYSYCESCYPGDSANKDINWKDMGEDIDGTTFDDCISHRRYGVEIECIDASDSSYSNNTAFQSKYDSSVASGGCEFVSPILCGDKGFEELRKMCKILSSNYADTNDSCGLHIHIDLTDFDDSDLARLFYFVQLLEPIARKFVPNSRNRNEFCNSSIEGMDFETKYENGFFKGLQRYSAYNFQSYNFRKTLEIRLHQGTIDYDEIRNWVSLHLAIVDYVKRRKSVGGHTENTIRELLPIIARDVSTFYAKKREKYYPMPSEERAEMSPGRLQCEREETPTAQERIEHARETQEALAASRRSPSAVMLSTIENAEV